VCAVCKGSTLLSKLQNMSAQDHPGRPAQPWP